MTPLEPQIILIGVSDRPHCRHLQLYLNILSVYDVHVHFIIVLNKMVVQLNELGQSSNSNSALRLSGVHFLRF